MSKAMSRKKAKQFGRAFAEIQGYGSYGAGVKATLYVGRKTGLNYNGWKEGTKIPKGKVIGVITEHRAKQIGDSNVAYSITATKGRYKGKGEKSINVSIVYTGDDGSPQKFFRNIKLLAQEVASALAQREVIVEYNAPRKRGVFHTASPPEAPPPTNKKSFCNFVRKHSKIARQDPQDDCYKPKSKRKSK